MGSDYSFRANEQRSWNDHSLMIDVDRAPIYKQLIDHMSSTVYICSKERDYMGLTYDHYFLTDQKYVIEFDGDDIFDAMIKVSMDKKISAHSTKIEFDDDMRLRAKQIVGATSYSLMLRNCQHCVTYIVNGLWASTQTTTSGPIRVALESYLIDSVIAKVNTKPAELVSPFTIGEHPMERDLERVFIYEHTRNIAQQIHQNDFNVVVLGPTGVGKSHLINLMANQSIVESRAGMASITKELSFCRGKIVSSNIMCPAGYIVDTIGLCDTVLSIQDVHKILKHAILSNLVHINMFIFMLPKRVTGDVKKSILQMLSWLNYDKYKIKFLFLINQTGSDSPKEKEDLITSSYTTLNILVSLLPGKEGSHIRLIHCVDTKYSIETKKHCLEVIKSHMAIVGPPVVMKEFCDQIV